MAEIIAFPQKEKRQKRKRPFSEQMYILERWWSRRPPTLERNLLIAMATGTIQEMERLGDLIKKRNDLNMKVIGSEDDK